MLNPFNPKADTDTGNKTPRMWPDSRRPKVPDSLTKHSSGLWHPAKSPPHRRPSLHWEHFNDKTQCCRVCDRCDAPVAGFTNFRCDKPLKGSSDLIILPASLGRHCLLLTLTTTLPIRNPPEPSPHIGQVRAHLRELEVPEEATLPAEEKRST